MTEFIACWSEVYENEPMANQLCFLIQFQAEDMDKSISKII